MNWMFGNATNFNKSLSSWNLTSINTANGIDDIFYGAIKFNNGENPNNKNKPLGNGWNKLSSYQNSFRGGGCILTNENSFPIFP